MIDGDADDCRQQGQLLSDRQGLGCEGRYVRLFEAAHVRAGDGQDALGPAVRHEFDGGGQDSGFAGDVDQFGVGEGYPDLVAVDVDGRGRSVGR